MCGIIIIITKSKKKMYRNTIIFGYRRFIQSRMPPSEMRKSACSHTHTNTFQQKFNVFYFYCSFFFVIHHLSQHSNSEKEFDDAHIRFIFVCAVFSVFHRLS